MSIKPKTGRRNYAKGGEVDDLRPDEIMTGRIIADPRPKGTGGGWLPGDSGGSPSGGPPDVWSSDVVKPIKKAPHSEEGQAEFFAMTPDKLYPGTEYARRWKKNSPNG